MKESFQKVGLSKGKKGEGNKKREERAFCFSFCFKRGGLQGGMKEENSLKKERRIVERKGGKQSRFGYCQKGELCMYNGLLRACKGKIIFFAKILGH